MSLEAARDILPRDLFDLVRTYVVPFCCIYVEQCTKCGLGQAEFNFHYTIGESESKYWGDSPLPYEWAAVKRILATPVDVVCCWCQGKTIPFKLVRPPTRRHVIHGWCIDSSSPPYPYRSKDVSTLI